jgi:hypothetical protein
MLVTEMAEGSLEFWRVPVTTSFADNCALNVPRMVTVFEDGGVLVAKAVEFPGAIPMNPPSYILNVTLASSLASKIG